MDTKTKDADTEQNAVTVVGPHALLMLVESLIRSHRVYMYILPRHFYSKLNIIAHVHITFIFIMVKLKNWTGESEHPENLLGLT